MSLFADLQSGVDIAGYWTGHYVQRVSSRRSTTGEELPEHVFPIEAWFEVDGHKLTGRMKDLRPSREALFSDAIGPELDSKSWVQRWRVRAYLSKHPGGIYRSSLYPESLLEGVVDDDKVFFTKVYAGPCEYSYREGDRESLVRLTNQTIRYQGRIREGGNVIAGTYELSSGNRSPAGQTFELRRTSEA